MRQFWDGRTRTSYLFTFAWKSQVFRSFHFFTVCFFVYNTKTLHVRWSYLFFLPNIYRYSIIFRAVDVLNTVTTTLTNVLPLNTTVQIIFYIWVAPLSIFTVCEGFSPDDVNVLVNFKEEYLSLTTDFYSA